MAQTTPVHVHFIELIKAQGYRVFIRGEKPTYCFFTDGTRIGYAQWEAYRQSVSSVHMANKLTGTGFGVADEITPASLKEALNMSYPHWATDPCRASVKKYADMDAYLKATKWNSELIEI
jgi:hypothetical protein